MHIASNPGVSRFFKCCNERGASINQYPLKLQLETATYLCELYSFNKPGQLMPEFAGKYRYLILAMVIMLTGCSVKFVYNQLDWLVPWYLDDYVTLTPDQETMLDGELQRYLEWHRKKQLPIYAEFLESVATDAEDGLQEQELEKIQRQLILFADDLFARIAPQFIDLFSQMEDRQIDEMFTRISQENDEYREKYIERSDIQHRFKRVNDVQKFIERWTGELDEKQVEMIEEWSKQYKRLGTEFLQSRLEWQADLRTMLKHRNNRQQLADALNDLFKQRHNKRTQHFHQSYAYNERLLIQLYARIDQSLTRQQRYRLIKKLKNTAEDFRELAIQ